ncbi:MAG: hypothetical protein C4346_18425 [Chloroflexota bacterium]
MLFGKRPTFPAWFRWFATGVAMIGGAFATLHGVAVAAPADALAGRLGGTRQTFEERYGPAHRSGIDWAYDVPGFGMVLVQFGTESLDGPALTITLRAPRPGDIPATVPHPNDWPLDVAEQRARAFLPADVRLAKRVQLDRGVLGQSCKSNALDDAFGAIDATGHACQVTYIMPTTQTVSFVTLSLASAGGIGQLATPHDPCEGIGAWAQSTSERLAKAETLLNELSTLSGDDAQAAPHLRGLAADFDRLAQGQRSSPVPERMITANYHLIAAFEAYRDGLATAADALERSDAAAIEQASALLAQADAATQQANAAMETAFAACGIAVGTPAAVP